MALNQYLIDTALLLNDPSNLFFSQAALTNYINRARNKVAQLTQCVRVLLPGTSSITAVALTSGGSGYTAPVVTVSAPDGIGTGVTAVVTVNAVGGILTGFTVVSGGSGYVATPTITITDPTGSGAIVGAITLSAAVKTVVGQEVYPFSGVTAALQLANPAAGTVYSLQSISVSWGSMKPTLDYCSWTEFQAKYRSYNIGEQNYPSIWSQYGRGAGGAAYLWPIPGQVSQMDWDAYCNPVPLVTDATVEAIPNPFTDSVPYYAAHLAFLNAQRKDDAEYMSQLFKNNMIENGVTVTPSYSPSAYDGD
jgi:hypothetical protein